MWYRYTSTFDFPQYALNHKARCWNSRKGQVNSESFLSCSCPYAESIKSKLREISRDYLLEELRIKDRKKCNPIQTESNSPGHFPATNQSNPFTDSGIANVANRTVTEKRPCEHIGQDIKDKKKMTPEEIQRIEAMPEISEFEAKLIFIRNLGRSDYKVHRFDVSSIIAKMPQTPLVNSSREDVLKHLDILEKCQKLIKSYIQGHQDEYAREVEPEIREKQRVEKSEKDAKKSGGPKTLEGFQAKHKISKDDLEKLLAFMNENRK